MKLIIGHFILVVWRVYGCNQFINWYILQWNLINIYFWHRSYIELCVDRHRKLGAKGQIVLMYVFFLILLFRQIFWFWLLNLRWHVGSVHTIHVNRARKSRDRTSEKKGQSSRAFPHIPNFSSVLNTCYNYINKRIN